MSGIKGRSGRRPVRDEERRRRVIDAAWDIIEKQLTDPNVPMALKYEVACKVVLKDMPSDPLIDVSINRSTTYVWNTDENSNSLQSTGLSTGNSRLEEKV